MANYQRPDQWDQRYVKLTAGDVKKFAEAMHNNKAPWVPLKNLFDNLDDQEKVKNEEMDMEVKKMIDKYSKPERRIAGAEVLKALSKELDFKNKALWFDREAEIAWFLQYVADRTAPKN
jgi:hypothetical protein